MGNLWIILAFLIPTLFLAYFYSPRLYQRFFRKWGHLPLGFTAEKFNYLFTPILTIIAVCTTYSAFYVQSHFNTVQMSNLKKERAEKIVFEFINMHGNMVKDIRVTDITSGNRSFHFIYYECMSLRRLLDSMISVPRWRHLSARPRSEAEVTTIAFKSCYFGISQEKNGALEKWVSWRYNGVYDDILQHFIREVAALQRMNDRRVYLTDTYLSVQKRDSTALEMKKRLKDATRLMNEYFNSDQVFLFADGHMPVLDSYMRLLRTTLKQFNYLTRNCDGKFILTDKEKEYYLDLLRSQLSSHEQLVISLYAFAELDLTDWFKSGFLNSQMECRNNLVNNVNKFLIEKRAGISDWDRYVSGNRRTLDSLQVQRYVDMNPRVWDPMPGNYLGFFRFCEDFSRVSVGW